MAWAIIFLIAIVLVALMAKRAVVRGYFDPIYGRKLLHVFAIGLSAISVYFIDYSILFWVVAAAIPIVFILVKKDFFDWGGTNINRWGIFYFPLIFFILLLLFRNQPDMVFFPLSVLALADGLASVIGHLTGNHRYRIAQNSKSLEGSAAFFLSTFFILYFLPPLLPALYRPFSSFFGVFMIAAFLTLLEAVSIKGRDNLWIPLAVVYWMVLGLHFENHIMHFLFTGVAIVVYFTYRMRWLTGAGALAAVLLAWVMVVSPEPIWLLPFIFFLASGSLMSKLQGRSPAPKSEARNANQVFFNGGLATVFLGLYFISSQMFFLAGSMASLSTALSDTASSELGSRWAKNTFNFTTGRRVKPGLSGGVSLLGMLVGFAFAAAMAAMVHLLSGPFDYKLFWVVLTVGFLGNLIDSVLGATLQIKYRANPAAPWSDTIPPGAKNYQSRGFKFMTNDRVNLMATAISAILGSVWYILL